MPFKSTRQHRQAQRFKAINEIAASGGATLTPIAYMPGRALQVTTSVFGFFNDDMKGKEKVVVTFQGVVALAHLIVLAILLSQGEKCTQKTTGLCAASLTFDLLYKAVLSIDMGTAELNRDKGQDHNTPDLSQTFSGSGIDNAPDGSPVQSAANTPSAAALG